MIIKFHLKRLGAAIASTLGLSYSVEAGVMDEYQTGSNNIATAKQALRTAKEIKAINLADQHRRHLQELRDLRFTQAEEKKQTRTFQDDNVRFTALVLKHEKIKATANLRDAYAKAYPKPVVRIPAFRPTPAPADAAMRDVTEAPPIGAVPA